MKNNPVVKKVKSVKAWAVYGKMKNGNIKLNPIITNNVEVLPIFLNKTTADYVRKTSPVLSLKVVRVIIKEIN